MLLQVPQGLQVIQLGVNGPRQLPSSNAMQSRSSQPQQTRNLPIRYGHYVTLVMRGRKNLERE